MAHKKISVTVDERVWRLVEGSATKSGVPVSHYVERALLWDLCENGNTEAIKIAMEILKSQVRGKLMVLPGIEVPAT